MITRITRDDIEHDALYCKSEDVEQLELENAELKQQWKIAEDERVKYLAETAYLKASNERLVKQINEMNNEYLEVCYNISADREVLKAKLLEAEIMIGVAQNTIKNQDDKLAEWKDVLGCYGSEPENVLHWIGLAQNTIKNLEAKLAELERQIKDRELIPANMVAEWSSGFEYPHSVPDQTIKQFAASRQKDGLE
jgi:chromosome segregation ATPase